MAFNPKVGQVYFMMNSRGEVKETTHTGSHKSQKRIAFGNAFATKRQAQLFRDRVASTATKKWWQLWR